MRLFSWLLLYSSSLLPFLLSILLFLPSLTGPTSSSERFLLIRSGLALQQPRCAMRGIRGEGARARAATKALSARSIGAVPADGDPTVAAGTRRHDEHLTSSFPLRSRTVPHLLHLASFCKGVTLIARLVFCYAQEKRVIGCSRLLRLWVQCSQDRLTD